MRPACGGGAAYPIRFSKIGGPALAAVHLVSEPVLLLSQLRGHVVTEVLNLENGTNFNFTGSRHWIGAARHPLDGLCHVVYLPYPETGHQFAGFLAKDRR